MMVRHEGGACLKGAYHEPPCDDPAPLIDRLRALLLRWRRGLVPVGDYTLRDDTDAALAACCRHAEDDHSLSGNVCDACGATVPGDPYAEWRDHGEPVG